MKTCGLKRARQNAIPPGSGELRSLAESVDQPADVVFRGAPAETHSHTALAIERSQATVDSRCTMESSSRVDLEMLTEQRRQLVGGVKSGDKTDDTRVLVAVRQRVHSQRVELSELLAQRAGERDLVLPNRFDACFVEKSKSRIEADESRRVVIAGLEAVRHCLRLHIQLAARTRAALAKRFEFRLSAGCNPQQPRTEWPEQSFMSGTGQKVRLIIRQLKWQMPGTLCGVVGKESSAFARNLAYLCHWLDDARHV